MAQFRLALARYHADPTPQNRRAIKAAELAHLARVRKEANR